MPRPRKCRKIGCQPDVTFFKPRGIPICDLEISELSLEELEAIRLKDFLGMDQTEASQKMGVSQPTFHRILLEARKKLAKALVEGQAIKIQS
ncbi:hypothetical protein COV93_04855 [Candidatus Woesearchaeota archaeon CG11_big_fil_rev_8_21_14_0_20_43_8]|nr:MAG: hypothetical protein COV93_04855 [Candidatus Woesearchaeota archaeon CG11_big_fil_rev_8_21_14_0_20_43_8]PIO07565.1 MAG: hypothetical protein COT47_01360 [Candidatus Woesearchaeota archaeon CG08_land_8_20_14_0_20_43_7]